MNPPLRTSFRRTWPFAFCLLAACGGNGTNSNPDVATDGSPGTDTLGGGDAPGSTDAGSMVDVRGTGDGSMRRDAGTQPTDVALPTDVQTVEAGNPGTADVQIAVDTTRARHPISPFIYGWNSPDHSTMRNVALGRQGGNRMTAYNWENNASNAGTDYFNENDDYLCSDTGCDRPGETVRRFVQDQRTHGAGALITVPIQSYVAADKLGSDASGNPVDVGNTPNYLATRFRVSHATKGSAFTLTPDASDTDVYQDEFVNWLFNTFPGARGDSARPILFSLDNEPDLWSSTHPRIHPNPATYAEMVSLSAEYAAAIKSVQPDALVLGPVNYGWAGYVNLQDAPDANNRDFLEFYLDQMHAQETTAGHRLLDALDVHWYSEAQGDGQRINDVNDGTGALARIQAPRSLWDPTYTEDSWITMYSTNGPINLIPRLMDKIAMHYPGTMLSISEYNYGGGTHISGGMAEADVLGIFGREGLFAATEWPLNTDESFIHGGFAMFRDYDGAGAMFGDVSVRADNPDAENYSAYASVDSASGANGGRVVVVLINKAAQSRTAGLTVTHTSSLMHAQVYQLTAANAQPQHAADVTATSAGAFLYAMPAMSVSTLVLGP